MSEHQALPSVQNENSALIEANDDINEMWEHTDGMEMHKEAAKEAAADSLALFQADKEKVQNQNRTTRAIYPDRLELDNGKTKILNTVANCRAMFRSFGVEACMNEMTGENTFRNIETNELETQMSMSFHSRFVSWAELTFAPQTMGDYHFPALTLEKKYHPVALWLGDAKWDGVERLNSVIGALKVHPGNEEYCEEVMKTWFAALMAAVYEAEFSVKVLPVLQGEQTFYKSAFVRRLFHGINGAYDSGSFNPSNKDDLIRIIGNWCYELSELDATTSRADVGKLKSELYKTEDTYRPPYGRGQITKKRRIVFIGTVNGTDFLKDQTGNDRFAVLELAAPVDMSAVNDALGMTYHGGEKFALTDPETYKQFWLEVRELYRNGQAWALKDETIKKQRLINDKFTDKGIYYPVIIDRLFSDNDGAEVGSVDECDQDGRAIKEGSGEFMRSTELCELCGFNVSQCVPFGKALKTCAREGLTTMIKKQGGKKYFWVSKKALNALRNKEF
ncbi:VapE domain-containing protein [Pantoea sp. A4]|uniref:VapE domain-containing protein n=1 Tax=Pantoea sp. A4 TaxID=1225184 RepID=UPI00035C805E|nr:VapE domain-containing protein [Pantoea sp. A4]